MTQLTIQLAATHDHWFQEPAAKHAYPALKLWWRHFSKQHAVIADGIEWIGCGTVAVTLLVGTLIANAWRKSAPPKHAAPRVANGDEGAADKGGDAMLARIGILQALYRDHEPEPEPRQKRATAYKILRWMKTSSMKEAMPAAKVVVAGHCVALLQHVFCSSLGTGVLTPHTARNADILKIPALERRVPPCAVGEEWLNAIDSDPSLTDVKPHHVIH
jgi:hypothetical protein